MQSNQHGIEVKNLILSKIENNKNRINYKNISKDKNKNKNRLLQIKSSLKRFFLYFSLLTVFVSSFSSFKAYGDNKGSNTSNTKTIGISQIVAHPALDAVRENMIAALKQEGFEEGKNLNILYENAQGNMVTSTQIASKLLSDNIDVGVAISTPSAQTLFYAAQKQDKKIPIVFSAVSDPKAAKLEPGKENYPITGVTDTANLDALLEVMTKMMPNLKTLGLMYNPAEANSVSTIERLKPMLKARGIKAYEVTVNNTGDVSQAMQSLIGNVDALYFPQDNTVVSALETVLSIAEHSNPKLPVILPIFCSDPNIMKRGILAAVGFDYKEVGKETGMVVAKILKGEQANNIPIHSPKEMKSVVNKDLANQLKLSVPKELKFSKVQFFD